MTDPESRPRWSVEQRLAYLERRLYWDGQINRGDLTDYFSISVPQASADISAYESLAPGNLYYDKSARAYLISPKFSHRSEPNARQYLSQLQLIADGVLAVEESWLGRVPPYGIVPRVRRKLAAPILRQVVEAIHTKSALRIAYQSVSSDEASKRWVVPHALGFDGNRWHVRGWCHRREKFLDFVLARVIDVIDRREEEFDTSADLAWHRKAFVRLGPNTALSQATQRAVALDFGMEAGVVEIEVRLSLIYYFSRQMLFDVAHSLPAERVQVILLNKDELNAQLAEVDEAPII